MLGTLKLPLREGVFVEVIGGPFIECPDDAVGVKMAREIPLPCAIDIPTEDFDVPHLRDLDPGLLRTVKHLLAGDTVYVGCMAGRGRTGLFLAVLAKAFGVEDPVKYVRKHYYSHAVETAEQKRFVESYPIPFGVRMRIQAMRFWSCFLPAGCLTRDFD